MSYDGQAAIELEALAETAKSPLSPLSRAGNYRYEITRNGEAPHQLDFSTIFPEILADMHSDIPAAVIAKRFHNTVAASIVDTCLKIREESGLNRVVLSGGVFQNRLLSEMVYSSLPSKGFMVFTHRLVPPNDGGIALGQAAVAAHTA